MENASKALIIAGAILLAILLISLGIMVFNQAQETTKNNGMNKAEVSMYNAQYTKYEGLQSGSNVRSLILEAQANNASDTANGSERHVTIINGDSQKTDTELTTTNVSVTTKYKVEISAYDDSGYISQITVTKNKKAL